MVEFFDKAWKVLKQNAGMKILSFLIAIMIWGIVTNSQNPEKSFDIRNVPIVFVNENKNKNDDLKVVLQDRTAVNVTLTGRTNKLAYVNKNNIQLKVYLDNITEPGEYELPIIATLPDEAEGVTLSFSGSKKVKVTVDKMVTKTFDVQTKLNGEVAKGYYIEKTELSNDTVKITGPEKELGKITKVYVETEVSSLTKTSQIVCPIKFEFKTDNLVTDFFTYSNKDITLDITVLKGITIPITVDLLNIPDQLSSEDFEITINPKQLPITGDEEAIGKLTDKISVGKIDVSNITLEGITTKIPVKLPAGIFVNKGGAEEVTVNIALKGLEKEHFLRQKVLFTDPNMIGKTYQAMDLPIQVILVGKASDLDLVNPDEIVLICNETIDADIEKGEYEFEFEVSIPGYPYVFGQNKYKVNVNIS